MRECDDESDGISNLMMCYSKQDDGKFSAHNALLDRLIKTINWSILEQEASEREVENYAQYLERLSKQIEGEAKSPPVSRREVERNDVVFGQSAITGEWYVGVVIHVSQDNYIVRGRSGNLIIFSKAGTTLLNKAFVDHAEASPSPQKGNCKTSSSSSPTGSMSRNLWIGLVSVACLICAVGYVLIEHNYLPVSLLP